MANGNSRDPFKASITSKAKVIHTELKDILASRFDIIKASLGVQNDAEVIRFLIQHYYQEKLEREADAARIEVEHDREIVKRFMDKYGPEWKKLGEDK